MFDEHTYLCLHWCYAHLNTVLELGTYAAEVPVHISHMESHVHLARADKVVQNALSLRLHLLKLDRYRED